jgi:carbonic anhydrase
MNIIEEVMASNEQYAQTFALGHLPMPPARKLAVVACMDARLSIEHALGLKTGDAHIIRNAGGIVNEDVIRSLVISHYLLGTQAFIVINHTDCGMLTFRDDEFLRRLYQETGALAVAPAQFCSFTDVELNVRQQLRKLHTHPWIPKGLPIRGFVYDVKTGKLNEVDEAKEAFVYKTAVSGAKV